MPASDPSRPSFGDRVRYHVDRFMSWSPFARFLGLFGLSFLLVAACALLAMAVVPAPADEPFDLLEALWWAMTRVADAGTMGDDRGTWVRAVAVLATLSGVMVVALLIGLVSSTLGEKFDDLRKGRSPVIDQHHTLILGYGEKVFTLLRELREANASQRSASVVILSEADKEEVENAVRERMGDMRNTRVIVRQGSPFSPGDLAKVGAGRARSIIVLASDADLTDDDVEGQADMGAIKTLLALRRVPGALTRNHATIELLDSSRKSVVERLGAGGVEVVAMRDTLSRLMVQTVRQRGVAEVYRNLLSYVGSELYFRHFPELDGERFGAAQWRLRRAVAVGVRRVESDGRVRCILNPPEDFLFSRDDQLLVLADDEDTFSIGPERAVELPAQLRGAAASPRQPERVLVCGFGASVRDVLRELDRYVLPGSEVCLMPGRSKEEVAEVLDVRELEVKNLSLKFVEGDPVSPDALRPLTRLGFSAALLVADDRFGPQEADARTVIGVLLLRELFAGAERPPRIISEILDSRTKDLLESDGGADFVVSSEITSMLLAQVSERRELNAVFSDLFDAAGNELYLKRAACYAPLGVSVGWLAVQKVARSRGEVALGYVRGGARALLNPPQEDPLVFSEVDRIIVVAEDDSEAPAQSGAARTG